MTKLSQLLDQLGIRPGSDKGYRMESGLPGIDVFTKDCGFYTISLLNLLATGERLK
ncbi:hypothetical protein [Algoriphagus confluentis]|uniref:hypothetical protein n=1 Tax=Algoriphagus confluentis TaxID=1697556 RepID=UPI0030C6D172